jgi:recombination protein RecR
MENLMSKAIPASVTRLIDAFAQLPGVGPKTASRLTYYLLRAPNDVAENLSKAITDLKALTKLCPVCFNITEEDTCGICQDAARDGSTVAVVEDPLDVLAMERTNSFTGRYHVLHGVVSPRDGILSDDLKIPELIKRLKAGGINELIICTNPGQLGDSTALIIQKLVATENISVRLTRLARGLPTGADLEYADSVTLMRAIQGRQAI